MRTYRDPSIPGFSNPWYAAGSKDSASYHLDDVSIRLLSLPYFIASKLTALFSRCMGDLRLSEDFEDIVFCLYYCSDIAEEIKAADKPVRSYIGDSITKLLSLPSINEAIYAVLPGGEVMEENVGIVR